MSKRLGAGAILVALALALAGLALHAWFGTGPTTRDSTFVIPRGASLNSAAYALEKAGIIRSARVFRYGAKLFATGKPIRYGEYFIAGGASPAAILRALETGDVLQRLVAIPEGMPSILVHEKLMAEPLLTGSVPVPPEGSILPDSYSFERGETRAKVLARMQAAMKAELAAAWKKRKPSTVVKTPAEAVNLAAIVEKETGKASERRTVAGVYSNRLRIGMKLDADPTVIYPITKGKPLGRRIKLSELRRDTGYNTYVKPGLPLGPIANPGRASIAAVLDPAPTKALYFVADGSGGHVFANTLAEHNANVAKWRAIRRQRGEIK